MKNVKCQSSSDAIVWLWTTGSNIKLNPKLKCQKCFRFWTRQFNNEVQHLG
jgi:hypothetical protein